MTRKALDATLVDSRILVVDDEPQYRTMMVRLLTRAGIRHIETASDGRDGLAKVERFKPDLIILDINMPVMNGYEMCERLISYVSRTPAVRISSIRLVCIASR